MAAEKPEVGMQEIRGEVDVKGYQDAPVSRGTGCSSVCSGRWAKGKRQGMGRNYHISTCQFWLVVAAGSLGLRRIHKLSLDLSAKNPMSMRWESWNFLSLSPFYILWIYRVITLSSCFHLWKEWSWGGLWRTEQPESSTTVWKCSPSQECLDSTIRSNTEQHSFVSVQQNKSFLSWIDR